MKQDQQADYRSAAIRQGLSQYIGALLDSIEGERKEKAQLITAAITEDALTLCLDPKHQDAIDFFIAKPILRAASFILAKRAEETRKDAQELPEEIRKNLLLYSARYEKTAQEIKSYVDPGKDKEGQS